MTLLPYTTGGASIEFPVSNLHFILPPESIAKRVPFSLPKKIKSPLITGDDLDLIPVGRLHNNSGLAGKSTVVVPDKSGLPLKTGQSVVAC